MIYFDCVGDPWALTSNTKTNVAFVFRGTPPIAKYDWSFGTSFLSTSLWLAWSRLASLNVSRQEGQTENRTRLFYYVCYYTVNINTDTNCLYILKYDPKLIKNSFIISIVCLTFCCEDILTLRTFWHWTLWGRLDAVKMLWEHRVEMKRNSRDSNEWFKRTGGVYREVGISFPDFQHESPHLYFISSSIFLWMAGTYYITYILRC